MNIIWLDKHTSASTSGREHPVVRIQRHACNVVDRFTYLRKAEDQLQAHVIRRIGVYHHAHRHIRLAEDDRTERSKIPHQHTFIVRCLRITEPAGEAASAVKTSNIEPVHETDG